MSYLNQGLFDDKTIYTYSDWNQSDFNIKLLYYQRPFKQAHKVLTDLFQIAL